MLLAQDTLAPSPPGRGRRALASNRIITPRDGRGRHFQILLYRRLSLSRVPGIKRAPSIRALIGINTNENRDMCWAVDASVRVRV